MKVRPAATRKKKPDKMDITAPFSSVPIREEGEKEQWHEEAAAKHATLPRSTLICILTSIHAHITTEEDHCHEHTETADCINNCHTFPGLSVVYDTCRTPSLQKDIICQDVRG